MTDHTPPAITDAEIARRHSVLEQAEHSGETEGQLITAETRADDEDYVRGRIDVDEPIARTRTRYGLE